MNVERLVAMANDIAAFFDAEAAGDSAAESVCTHLKKFWEPRMRRQIVEHLAAGGEGLTPTARAGVQRLGS
jgi:formate dehydrogenase subunit delta